MRAQLSERVKRGMSNLWDSGCLGPIAKDSSLRRDPFYFFAAVRLGESIRLTSAVYGVLLIVEGG